MATKAKQIENLLVLRTVIEDLPVHSFVPGLSDWTDPGFNKKKPFNDDYDPSCNVPTAEELMANGKCGAAACVGGWVAIIPHFAKQGVKRDTYAGAPELYNKGYYIGGAWDVARELFGYNDLFEPAGGGEADPRRRKDESWRAWGKRCALARIDTALEQLLSSPPPAKEQGWWS